MLGSSAKAGGRAFHWETEEGAAQGGKPLGGAGPGSLLPQVC